MVYHFFRTIFSCFVPVCAAISFFRSPMVSSGLHFTRTCIPSISCCLRQSYKSCNITFLPKRSLQVISIIFYADLFLLLNAITNVFRLQNADNSRLIDICTKVRMCEYCQIIRNAACKKEYKQSESKQLKTNKTEISGSFSRCL